MKNSVLIVDEGDTPGIERIAVEDVLAPGYYWRLKEDFKVQNPRHQNYTTTLHAGDVHLLLDIFENEGTPHTAIILEHPRDGGEDEHRILIADFLTHFEPAPDAEAVRKLETDEIMASVAAMQQEMAAAQDNPLALPSVQKAVDDALEELDQKLRAEVMATQAGTQRREADLRRVHRRAARRSQEAGNPLVVRSVTVSDNIGLIIDGGINSEGLKDLNVEARKRIAMAQATSNWLTTRGQDVAKVMKGIAPYYGEKGRVALARASKTIHYVKRINEGLNSLKLYTGDGIDVIPVTEGEGAQTDLPLTLVQGKRFMDEELAVWADVDEKFDWTSKTRFFDELKTTPALVAQVFPTRRCVVSMAVTARRVEYDRNISAFERMRNDIQNRRVFLLVRNGDNISVVYSTEPSHEAAARLFPRQSEVEGVFRGIDGTKIGLQDVAFGQAAQVFDDLALHYKRFLILLCGLDHRLKLFGDFYPAHNTMQFMSMEFQGRYFDFLEDDDPAKLLGDAVEPVANWIARCNKAVVSGSRIVVVSGSGMSDSSPGLQRLVNMDVSNTKLERPYVVAVSKGHHYINVPVSGRHRESTRTALVWLDGPNAGKTSDWFLCMDQIRLQPLRHYIYSRLNRHHNVAWIRTFKRAEAVIAAEQAEQKELRDYLVAGALESGVLAVGEVQEAMEAALSTWRAARRGAGAPGVDDTKAVNELLTLMYPSDRIAAGTERWIAELLESTGATPLQLCRNAKNKLVLYVEATQADREPFTSGVHWGWVKRLVLEVKKTRVAVATESMVWLRKDKPDASEVVMRQWPALQAWLHSGDQPCQLKCLELAKQQMAAAGSEFASMLAQGRDQPTMAGIEVDFLETVIRSSLKASSNDRIVVVVPVGVIQVAQEGPVRFLYAKTTAALFVRRYASPEQWAVYAKRVLKGSRQREEHICSHDMWWSLVQTAKAVKGWVQSENALEWGTPANITLDGYAPGGLRRKDRKSFFDHASTTRAQRRAAGGMPCHKSERHTLSWNRRIDTLLGLAPHLRRNFYVEKRRWSWADSDRDTDKRYTPPAPIYELSPLVWDGVKQRSVANRYFSTVTPKSK